MKNNISKNIALILVILLFAVQIVGSRPEKRNLYHWRCHPRALHGTRPSRV